MPYQSLAQAGYLHIHEPALARKWDKETPRGLKLPEHVTKDQAEPPPDESPNVAFMRKFNDPSQWKVVRRVPVFSERTERNPDTGQPEVLDLPKLRLYAANCNALVRSGNPPGLTLGHTKDDAPEGDQPPTVGWARNFQVGRDPLTGKWTIYQDEQYLPEHYREARTYPYRSVERWTQSQIFKPIALLRREPEINLGVVTYRAAERVVRYSRESYMAEPADNTSMPPAAAAPAAAPAAEPEGLTPEENQQMDRYMAHHPVMRYVKTCYDRDNAPPEEPAAPMPAAAAPAPAPAPMEGAGQPVRNAAFPSGTNTAVPAAKPDEVTRMQADSERIRYSRVEQENTALKARIEALEARDKEAAVRYQRSEAEKLAVQLEGEGFELDRSALVGELAPLDAAARQAVAERVRKYHKRSPAGVGFGVPAHNGWLAAEPSDVPGAAPQMGMDRLEKVKKYMHKHNLYGDEGYKTALEKCPA